MGYNTNFSGTLFFKNELTMPQMIHLEKILEQDIRDLGHSFEQFIDKGESFYHIDVAFSDGYKGLEWSGSEKTYGMVEIINTITNYMKNEFPNFELTGEMFAQGEEPGNIWKLVMVNGKATRKEASISFEEKNISCPNCGHDFDINA